MNSSELPSAKSGEFCNFRKKLVHTDILHHCQQQAFRPVPQKINFLVEQAGKPVHKRLIDNGATYEFIPLISNAKFICCGTGILPVLEKGVTYEF